MKVDPKVAFFLKHERQIEEWIGLRERAIEAADAFFRSLAPDVNALAPTLPGAAIALIDLEHRFPKLFLYRENWALGKRWPRVAVGMEWESDKANFAQSWIGVWLDVERDHAAGLREALDAELRDVRRHGTWEKPDRWWPLSKCEVPSGTEYWDDFDLFRKQLLRAIGKRWEQCWSAVERAVAKA